MVILYVVLFIWIAIIQKNAKDEYRWNSRLIWDTLFWEKSALPLVVTVGSILASMIIAWLLNGTMRYRNAESLVLAMVSISFVLLGLTFNYTKPYYYYFSMKEVFNYYGLKILFLENIFCIIIYSFIKLGLIRNEFIQKVFLTELILLNGIIEFSFIILLLGESKIEFKLLLQLRHVFQCSDYELHQGDLGKVESQSIKACVAWLSNGLYKKCHSVDKNDIKVFSVLDDKEIKLYLNQKRARKELGIILLVLGMIMDYNWISKIPCASKTRLVSIILNILWFVFIIEPPTKKVNDAISMWATLLIPRAVFVSDRLRNQIVCKYLRRGKYKKYLDYVENLAAMMYILRKKNVDESIIEEAMDIIVSKFDDGFSSFSKKYALLVIGYFASSEVEAIKPIRTYFDNYYGPFSEQEKRDVLKEVAYLSKRINRVRNKQEYYNVPYFEEYYASALGKANCMWC